MTAVGVRARSLFAEATVVAGVALLVVAIVLALWKARWGEPFNYGGDAPYYLMVVRTMGRYGTYLANPHLGWPFGQHLADYPEGGDNLHWAVLAGLGWLTGSAITAVNVFYIASFATVAATAHVALRVLGVRRVTAAAVALLFAFLPYHFARNENHLMLSSYPLVPLAVVLAMALMSARPPLVRSVGIGLDWWSGRTWLVVLACVGLASTGSYYFTFAVILFIVAGVTGSLAARSWRPAVAAGLVISVSSVVFTLNLLPSILQRLGHGAAAGVAQRSPAETERYGLRISQLFLPRDHHRIVTFAHIAQSSQTQTIIPSEAGQQLGLIGAGGLLALCALFVVCAVSRQRTAWWDTVPGRRLSQLGLLALTCMLVGAVGSIGYLASAVGLRPIRAWNRISVVIGFCALAAVALLIDDGVCRIRRHVPRWGGLMAIVLPLAVVTIGLADQTSPADQPAYAAIHQRYDSDRAFFQSVADRLSPGTPVFELPYISFPEASMAGVGPYDQAGGFLFQPQLAWSFGFVRGRHPEYPMAFGREPVADWLPTVVAIGFRAIVVNRAGYPDNASALDLALQRLAVRRAAVSRDGRYAFYDLGSYASGLLDRTDPKVLSALAQHALSG